MRRAPIVVAATAAGFAAVMTFHPKTSAPPLGTVPAAGAGGSSVSGASSTTRPPAAAGGAPPAGPSSGAGSAAASSAPPSGAPSSTTSPSASQTVTGASVNYNYGTLSVVITVSGHTITNVGIASLDDGGNFRSQSIDRQAIPVLEQQAMQAQSANIQGVSGASYTSAGFARSLQSALSKAGL